MIRRVSGRFLRGVLLSLMIGMVGTPLSAAAEQGASSVDDVVIALDHSDSMRDSDPEGMRIEAAKSVIGYLNILKATADARVGVVGFGSTYPTSDWEEEQKLPPRVLLDLTKVSDISTNKLDLQENKRFPGTDFHAALCLSWTTVVGRRPPDAAECPDGSGGPVKERTEITNRSRSVVLITDGLPAPHGDDLLKESNEACPAQALKVISTTEDARCYFRGLEEAWRAMTDSVPVDLYIAGIDVRNEWYDFSEEYWRGVTGCKGKACEVHVQKVADPKKIVEAIVGVGGRISVNVCQLRSTGQENVRVNVCELPAGIAEAAFVVKGLNVGSDAELKIKRPGHSEPSSPSARALEKLNEAWHVLVNAPPAGEWEVWIEGSRTVLSSVRVEVVASPAPFTLRVDSNAPFASWPVPLIAEVKPGSIHAPSIEQYTFELQRAVGDKSEDSLEVRLDPGQNRPPGEYEFDLQGRSLTNKAGRWTFRLTTEIKTPDGARQTLYYGSTSIDFRDPEPQELSVEIKKKGDLGWGVAELELRISNPGSYAVGVAPRLVASPNGRVKTQVPQRLTVPGNAFRTVPAELECMDDGAVQITGTVGVLTVDGVRVPDGKVPLLTIPAVPVKCLLAPDLTLEIQKKGDVDWGVAELELRISNPGSYPVDVAPRLVASPNGRVKTQVPQRLTVPANGSVAVPAELECMDDGAVQITGAVDVLTVGKIPPLTIPAVPVKCLLVPDLTLETQKKGNVDWGVAELELRISNPGSYPVDVAPRLVASPNGRVKTQVPQRLTVPANGSVAVPAELECTDDSAVQITGTVNVLMVDGVRVPGGGNFTPLMIPAGAVKCLLKPALEIEVQRISTPAPNRAKVALKITNPGLQDVEVKPELFVVEKSEGQVKTQVPQRLTVPSNGSVTVPAELECMVDASVPMVGRISVLKVGDRDVGKFKRVQLETDAPVSCAPPPDCEQFDSVFRPDQPQLEVYQFGFRLDEQFPFRPRFREQVEQEVQIGRDSSSGLCMVDEVVVELLMYPADPVGEPCASQAQPGCARAEQTTGELPLDVKVAVPDPGTSEASFMRRVTVNGTWSAEEKVELLVPWWAQYEPLWSVFVTVAALLAALGVTSSISTRIIRHEYRDYEEPARICDLAAVRASDGVPMSLVRLGFIPWRTVDSDEQYPRFYLTLAGFVAGPLVVRFVNSQGDGQGDDPWEIEDDASGSVQKRAKQWWAGVSRFKTLLIGRRVEGDQFELSEDNWVSLNLEDSLDGD